MSNRIELAKNMAHEAHDSIRQKRKYSGEAYWIHTDAVAEIVSKETDDEDVIIAAHLHDVIEDVTPENPKYSIGLIIENFGSKVANLVIELSHVYTSEAYPHLNRAKRKKLERDRLAIVSNSAKLIKLADTIDNTKTLLQDDPDFAKTFFREKLDLLPHLRIGSENLYQRALKQITI